MVHRSLFLSVAFIKIEPRGQSTFHATPYKNLRGEECRLMNLGYVTDKRMKNELSIETVIR
jgi:hypothetical protein